MFNRDSSVPSGSSSSATCPSAAIRLSSTVGTSMTISVTPAPNVPGPAGRSSVT